MIWKIWFDETFTMTLKTTEIVNVCNIICEVIIIKSTLVASTKPVTPTWDVLNVSKQPWWE